MIAVLGYASTRREFSTPDPPIGKFPYEILLVPVAIYLSGKYIRERDYMAEQREKAKKMSLSVETFRAQELSVIQRLRNPCIRFFARRHLKRECELLSRWQRKKQPLSEMPIQKPGIVESGLVSNLRASTK